MARPLRVQLSGVVYYVVLRANSRQAFFRDNRDRQWFLGLLGRYREQFAIKIYAYLLTTRQVDLLLETPRHNLSKVMQCLGTSYVSYFNRRHKRRGTLFEGRFKSYLVDKEEGLTEATRFIHSNRLLLDLRGKRNYAWCSYRFYLGKGATNIVEIEPVLNQFEGDGEDKRRRYQEFVESGTDAKRREASAFCFRQMNRDEIGNSIFPPQNFSDELAGGSTTIAERILHEVKVGLGAEALEAARERKRRALVRQVTMYLIRKQTDLSLSAIGELLGVKPPAVAQGIAKVQRLLTKGELPNRVQELIETVSSLTWDISSGAFRAPA